MPSNNGRVAQLVDDVYPSMQMGEDVNEGDLLTLRAGAGSIVKWYKAFGGVTGGGNTQGAAMAVAMKTMKAGAWDAAWTCVRLNQFVTTSGELNNLAPGAPVYLSVTTPGQMQAAAPSGTGKLSQIVGYAYNTAKFPTSADDADGVRLDVDPRFATTLS